MSWSELLCQKATSNLGQKLTQKTRSENEHTCPIVRARTHGSKSVIIFWPKFWVRNWPKNRYYFWIENMSWGRPLLLHHGVKLCLKRYSEIVGQACPELAWFELHWNWFGLRRALTDWPGQTTCVHISCRHYLLVAMRRTALQHFGRLGSMAALCAHAHT